MAVTEKNYNNTSDKKRQAEKTTFAGYTIQYLFFFFHSTLSHLFCQVEYSHRGFLTNHNTFAMKEKWGEKNSPEVLCWISVVHRCGTNDACVNRIWRKKDMKNKRQYISSHWIKMCIYCGGVELEDCVML